MCPRLSTGDAPTDQVMVAIPAPGRCAAGGEIRRVRRGEDGPPQVAPPHENSNGAKVGFEGELWKAAGE